MSTERHQPTIVFLCVHNAGRSQMAAAWARSLGGADIDVYSGGSEPADSVSPGAVEVMAEVGIDLAGERPRRWADDEVRSADIVVTMGCGDSCPVFPGVRYEDWPVADPTGLSLEQVRAIRDEIRVRVEGVLSDLGGTVES
jgi:arsenate reductase